LLAERLLGYIKQKEITFIKVTPSLFSVIVNSPGFSKITCKSLRLAAVGGEPINVKDIEKAHSLCGHLKIMNHYGPTEATIGCAATIINFDEFAEYKTHPVIGKPIANTGIYILGKDLELLPIGVPGELCISGAGVGMGYLNQPELTAEKFDHDLWDYQDYHDKKNKSFCQGGAGSPDLSGGGSFFKKSPPMLHGAEGRIYITGDLARWLPKGTIEFLGRIDNQVKVRGYRIELGEIENRLRKYPKVEEALVVVKESAASDKYLCAYIVSREEKQTPHAVKTGKPGFHKKAVSFREAMAEGFGEQMQKNPLLDQYAERLARIILEKYDDRYKLSTRERTRYKRQMLLAGWGQSSQEKLKATTVFVAGAGGGASPTVTQLALAGLGTIKICDFDEVELSNLNRQFLHDDERLGMNKALSAKIAVSKINPHVKVVPFTQKLTRENVFELVGDSAIIFDMFDDPLDKFLLSECAVIKQIPHLILSMTDINAYAAVLHSPHTPCYHCLFDKVKLETIISGMKHHVENYSKNPLPVVSTSLFISSGIIVNEALKILLGFEKPAYNRFFYFNQRGAAGDLVFTAGYKAMTHLFSEHFIKLCKEQGFDWESGWRDNFLEEFKIEPDPDCPLCGSKGMEKRKGLEDQVKKTTTAIYVPEEKKEETGEHQQIIALLLNGDSNHAIGSMGAMKSGKTYVPLDPAYSMEVLTEILEDAEARIIVTDNMDRAEKLRDRVNKHIALIDIDSIENVDEARDKVGPIEFPIEIHPEQTAYILYLPDSDYDPGKTNSLPEALRDYLREELPDYMIPSYFVSLDKIPMTPNGKVDRNALPEPGIKSADEFRAPENETEEKLVEIWSKILRVEKIGLDDDFFALGLDSIKAIQAAARMSKDGLRVGMNDIFLNPTISQLSHYVIPDDSAIDQGVIEGEVKLTPSQQWFFESNFAENHHFNMAVMLYREEGFETEFVQSAFEKIVEHHDALRIVFESQNGNFIQRNRNINEKLFDLEIINLEKEENSEEIIQREADRIQKGINLKKGPLVKLGLFKTAKGDHLLVVIHHLVVDGISWRILFEDIETLFQQYKKGEKFNLPPKSTSFKHWAEKLSEYANGKLFLKEKAFWVELETTGAEIPRLVRDFEEDRFEIDSDALSSNLSEEETASLLTEVHKAFGTEINDILLTALGLAFKKIQGHNYLLITMEGHGREQILDDVDINRTIGWFTTIYPVLLNISYESDLSRQIKEVKEILRRLPNKGIGYGILKYLTAGEHKKEINFGLNPQISFNYLGQFDSDVEQMSSIRISNIPTGNTSSTKVRRPYDLDISGMIADKQLRMTILFSKKQFKRKTIETLWNCFEAELRHIISFCLSRDETEVTPGDFTFKGLSIDQFDKLFG
jgi:non-ribosomal peptide synthase protein (TIGR01720 family)